ncbi:MAG: hypothetical protein AB1724_01615 [Thermodesulfobacteriota bacterium]
MKKKILIAAGVLIGALLVMMAASAVVVGPMVRSAVNTQGPKMMGTAVKAEDVDAALFSDGATLTGFVLGNPPGFETPQAATVKEIRIRLDKKSLLTNRTVIESVEVISPHLNFEIQEKTDNFRALLSSMRKAARAGQPAPGQKPSRRKKTEKQMLIREVIIREGLVDLAAAQIKETPVTVPLPELRLTNVGAQEGGLTPDKVFKMVLYRLYNELHSPPLRDAFNDQLKIFETSVDQLRGVVPMPDKDSIRKRKNRSRVYSGPVVSPEDSGGAPASAGAFEE